MALFLLSAKGAIAQERIKETGKKVDSLQHISLMDTLALEQRIDAIDTAYSIASRSNNDSLINQTLKTYIKVSWRVKDWGIFQKRTHEHLALALKANDSLGYGKTNEYLGRYYMDRFAQDSAFYYYRKAFDVFDAMGDSLRAGRILVSRAIIEKNISDYPKSIATSLLALDYLKSDDDMQRKSSIYNTLASVYNQLGDKGNSLRFHKEAYSLRKDIPDKPYLTVHSLNNIGRVHQKHSEYGDAIWYYDTALGYSGVLATRPSLRAMLMDNRAFSRFMLGETEGVLTDMEEAYRLRETEGNTSGLAINSLHLAKYHMKMGDGEEALKFSRKAESLSQKIDNHRDYLESLKLLGNLEDGVISKSHFNRYIAVKDSLDAMDRNYQKTIASMFFEIKDAEEENDGLKEQSRLKQIAINVSIAIIIGLLVIAGWQSIQRARRKSELRNAIEQIAQMSREIETLSKPKERGLHDNFDLQLKAEYNINSEKQRKVWHALALGLTTQEIAGEFGVSKRAIAGLVDRLYKKLEEKTGIPKVRYRHAITIYLDEIIDFKDAEIAKVKENNNPPF